jgi:hypothetical protein
MMAEASSHCRYCGRAEPHAHSDEELYTTHHVRPAFEKMFVKRYQGSDLSAWKNIAGMAHGYGYNPTPDSDGLIPYPQYFGWEGTPRKKNFGGLDAYPDHCWAYRPSFMSNYAQDGVHTLWCIFEEAWYASKDTLSLVEFQHSREAMLGTVLEPEKDPRGVVVFGVSYPTVEIAAKQMGITPLQMLVRLNDPFMSEYNYA